MKTCKHFNDCGGCRLQDILYKDQLSDKENRIKELISSYRPGLKLNPINPSQSHFYRNKMEFTFAADGRVICGLYSKKQKGKVVDLEECLIFSKDAGKLLSKVKEFVNKLNYSVYNKYSHQGFLRNLIIRQTKFTGQTMVAIVTTSKEQLDKDNLVKELLLLELESPISSIYWVINDSLSDAVVFERKKLLYGEAYLKEELGELSFKIDVDSFFQVNPRMSVNFYKKIRDYANLTKKQNVLDLFCGVGSIGIFLAASAKFVWGIEAAKAIVDMAWQNARENKVENISFIVSDVRRFLNTQKEFYKDADLLVVNPPRSGLSNKIIRAILRFSPKAIIYSSCNPEAFFRDLEGLKGAYKPDFIEPFDFFPHTPHLECLSLLKPV